MATSYKVQVWKLRPNKLASGKTSYSVRWKVGDRKPFIKTYANKAQADGFRSELLSAAKKGEPFDLETGRPVSMQRSTREMSWYEFACAYVEMKWPDGAATTRRGIAEAMVTATCGMFSTERAKPDGKLLRSALFNWAFNMKHRADEKAPQDVVAALRWVERNTRNVSALADPSVLRPVMNGLARKVDGKRPVAATVANRKRAVLFNALEYAVELKLLDKNPIPELKWKAPKVEHAVDPRVAANPVQARTLLRAATDVQRSGQRLMACYACSYYSALRPEEAVNLREHNIKLPALVWSHETQQWEEPAGQFGELHLEKTAPHAGSRWTDEGTVRDDRGLKHRPRTTTRQVPIPPELVRILRAHLAEFGADQDGRLFRGERGGEVPVRLYNAVWRKARTATFTADVLATPLAATPYDLRHACVSTWLNAGVEPTRVAEWAGHSVEVLYKVYAKCLHGREHIALQRIAEALR